MAVDLQAQGLGLLLQLVGGRLSCILGDDQTADVYAAVGEGIDEPEHLGVVSDPDVLADLVLDDVLGVDDDDGLRLGAEFHEHPDLGIGHETGEDAGCVVVIEKLSAELQIQLAAELGDALPDVLGLRPEVHLVVESAEHF